MFPSPCFNAHFEVLHQKRVMETANFEKKKCTLAWDALCLLRKRVNANNGRWKRICRINSSMRIKIALCGMGWHNLTNQRTDLVAQHLKCCYGHSEMPEQSLSKYFCIFCLPEPSYMTVFLNSRHPRKQWPHSLCFVCSLWGASLFFHFSLWYLVSVYQEVMILSDENGAYSEMFYATL